MYEEIDDVRKKVDELALNERGEIISVKNEMISVMCDKVDK